MSRYLTKILPNNLLTPFKDGLESDMIIRLRDGRWAAVEVKLGCKEIETAAIPFKAQGKSMQIKWVNRRS